MAETVPGEERPREPGASKPAATDPNRTVIKKYANRRLYNTGSSSYVTLEHLAEMVRKGDDFVVYDARTNEDITRQVLTQIIFEAENSGQNLLPIQFLRQLIQMYGQQIQAFVPSYLEMSLDAFTRQGEQMREHIGASSPGAAFGKTGFASAEGYRLFQEQVRQNMALFDEAMKMFTPFSYARAGETAARAEPASPTAPAPQDETLAELKSRMDEMQRQLERLSDKG